MLQDASPRSDGHKDSGPWLEPSHPGVGSGLSNSKQTLPKHGLALVLLTWRENKVWPAVKSPHRWRKTTLRRCQLCPNASNLCSSSKPEFANLGCATILPVTLPDLSPQNPLLVDTEPLTSQSLPTRDGRVDRWTAGGRGCSHPG